MAIFIIFFFFFFGMSANFNKLKAPALHFVTTAFNLLND